MRNRLFLIPLVMAVLSCFQGFSCGRTPNPLEPWIDMIFTTNQIFYVDPVNGNDANSGADPQKSWQTLTKVNGYPLLAGSQVLFKRGMIFRGQLIPQSGNASAPVRYAAYGTGAKPVILGSAVKTNASDWINESGNIWKCAEKFSNDIGSIIFTDGSSYNFGYKKWGMAGLTNQGAFWFDRDEGKSTGSGTLHIYSVGNPASFYPGRSLELALDRHVVWETDRHDVTYEDLDVRYGGAHGFGGGSTYRITIRRCDVSYMGGGDLDGVNTERYGNGIEFWGNAHDNLVEHCRIWEIYDTGVTSQNHTTAAVQYNITYRYNVIWNCGMGSFEQWNRPAGSSTENIYFENNTCAFAGSGWGSGLDQRPVQVGAHLVFWANEAATGKIYIRNNVFYIGLQGLFYVEKPWNGLNQIVADYNCYYQQTNGNFYIYGTDQIFTVGQFAAYQKATGFDAHSIAADPQLVNAAATNFRLTPASPCVDKGVKTFAVSDADEYPVPSGNGYDMGAFEFH